MSYIVSEVYEVFIAVVTVVLLTSLFTGALLHDSTLARVRPFSQPLVHDTTA